jgi:LacI family transcriptional regulator
MHEMGRRGVDLLIEVLGGARPESERLSPTLMVRESG